MSSFLLLVLKMQTWELLGQVEKMLSGGGGVLAEIYLYKNNFCYFSFFILSNLFVLADSQT